jgi:hypothetical protein
MQVLSTLGSKPMSSCWASEAMCPRSTSSSSSCPLMKTSALALKQVQREGNDSTQAAHQSPFAHPNDNCLRSDRHGGDFPLSHTLYME